MQHIIVTLILCTFATGTDEIIFSSHKQYDLPVTNKAGSWWLGTRGVNRTSHVTRHTSNVTRHTSHITRHTSHITHHTSPAKLHAGTLRGRQ